MRVLSLKTFHAGVAAEKIQLSPYIRGQNSKLDETQKCVKFFVAGNHSFAPKFIPSASATCSLLLAAIRLETVWEHYLKVKHRFTISQNLIIIFSYPFLENYYFLVFNHKKIENFTSENSARLILMCLTLAHFSDSFMI